jgi:WD40 repeat protein
MRNLEKDSAPLCYFNNGKKSSITSVSFSSFNPVLLSASSMDETLTFYDVNEKKSVKVITAE